MNFIQTICSEAGVPTMEPPPDADVRAIDLDVTFPEGNVHVQVKCSAKLTRKTATSMSWPIEQGWVDKWIRLRNPVYFVIVRVPPGGASWIEHGSTRTVHQAYAVWARVEPASLRSTIRVPLENRFSASTLAGWQVDLNAGYNATPVAGLT